MNVPSAVGKTLEAIVKDDITGHQKMSMGLNKVSMDFWMGNHV